MIANSPDIDVYYYSVRQPDGFGWGHFYISSTGMVACYSDYENAIYRWTHFGDGDFRKWFVECIDNGEKSYVLNKFFPGMKFEELQSDRTVTNIKNHIIEWFRDGSWTKEEARKEWDLLEEYVGFGFDDVSFSNWLSETSIHDAYELAFKDYPYSIHMFWDKLMPLLSVEIHKEIDGVVE